MSFRYNGVDRIGLLEKGLDSNMQLISRQLILIRTRVDAIEATFFGNRLSLIWTLIVAIISPRMMADKIKRAHDREIKKFEKATNESRKKITSLKGASLNGIIS